MSEIETIPDVIVSSSPSIPHSREAEESVLGAVMINPDAFYDLSEFLRAGDFYVHRHRWIWDAFQACVDFDRPIDFVTVSDVLESQSKLSEIGGAAYLTALINQAPNSLNAEAYGRIVEAHAVRRQMISKANQIASLAYNESMDIESALAEYDKLTEREGLTFSSVSNSQDADDAAQDLLAEIENGVSQGVPTGFPHFDKWEELGGLPIGATLMIGDSSMGKSAWWLQVCEQATEHYGKRALYFGLESPNRQAVLRRVAGMAGIDGRKIRSGSLSEEEKEALRGAINNIYLGRFEGRLKLNSQATTLRAIEREIRLFHPDLVVVDQINQIEDEFGDNKTITMLKVFTKLKALGNKYGCAVGVVHAINPSESEQFFEKNKKAQDGKTQKNSMPDLNAIPWAKQIKHVTDVLLVLVPEVNQQLIGSKKLKIGIWIMKDRDGARFIPTIWEYDLVLQWFSDNGVPRKPNAQVPSNSVMF